MARERLYASSVFLPVVPTAGTATTVTTNKIVFYRLRSGRKEKKKKKREVFVRTGNIILSVIILARRLSSRAAACIPHGYTDDLIISNSVFYYWTRSGCHFKHSLALIAFISRPGVPPRPSQSNLIYSAGTTAGNAALPTYDDPTYNIIITDYNSGRSCRYTAGQ